MNEPTLDEQFNDLIQDEGYLLVMYNMAQDLVQECEDKRATQLNIIVGTSFALLHAIRNYKEINNGKSIKHRS